MSADEKKSRFVDVFLAPAREKSAAALAAGPLSWSIPAAILVGLLVVLFYRCQRPQVDLVGVLFVAGGAAVVGVFLGFLFGIPKIATRRAAALPDPKAEPKTSRTGVGRRLDPNTNLEEISDWLTKIIVGITLVEAGALLERFDALISNASALGIPKAGAGGIVVYFSVAGFLAGYLWTRLVLTRQFAAGDRAADDASLNDILRQAGRIEASTALDDVFGTIRQLVNLNELRAALNVGRVFLERDAEISARIFLYLKEHASRGDTSYYTVLSNLGYSYIGQGKYSEAIEELHSAIRITGIERARPWHTVALAYAYYKTNEESKYREWLSISQTLREFEKSRENLAVRYREIKADLQENDSAIDTTVETEQEPE